MWDKGLLLKEEFKLENSLVVHPLLRSILTAEGSGSIPGQKIHKVHLFMVKCDTNPK